MLNGLSAQSGYTVPFMLVHTEKCRTQDKLTIQTMQKLKHNPEKASNTKHSKTKLPWFCRLLQYSARKRGELILQHIGMCLWTNWWKSECWDDIRPWLYVINNTGVMLMMMTMTCV